MLPSGTPREHSAKPMRSDRWSEKPSRIGIVLEDALSMAETM